MSALARSIELGRAAVVGMLHGPAARQRLPFFVLLAMFVSTPDRVPAEAAGEATADPQTTTSQGEASGDHAGDYADDHRVDIGGHALRARILGQGAPTVVFDTGMGDGLDRWGPVPRQVAEVAQVVLYDRSGYGLSEMGPPPRTSERVATELHSLLEGLAEQGVEPPYVLVAHSVSGLYARAFTHLFPDEVAGLVLIDPSIEGMAMHLATEEGQAQNEAMLARLDPWMRDEGRSFWDNLQAAPGHRVPDPPIPAVVLSGSAPAYIPPEEREKSEAMGFDLEKLKAFRELKLGLAAMLAEKLSARHVLAEKSGHYVHHDEPDVVVTEILAVLETLRSISEAPDGKSESTQAEPPQAEP